MQKKINWNLVYQQQADKLVGTAYRYVKDRRQAEDIVQNSFLVAIEKVGTYKGKGAFEAWLRRIVINESLMFLRSRKMNFVESLQEYVCDVSDQEDEEDEGIGAYKQVIGADFSAEELMETINLLSEHHRLVFYLYVVDLFSHKEIASKLDISEGTSKSHLNRARKKLQELLYLKAMNRKEEKKKRLAIVGWWTGMFGGTFSVDKLYASTFKDFSLPAPSPSLSLQQSLQQSVGGSIGISSLNIALCVGGAAVGSIGTWYLASDLNTAPSSQEVFIQECVPNGEDATALLSDTLVAPFSLIDSTNNEDIIKISSQTTEEVVAEKVQSEENGIVPSSQKAVSTLSPSQEPKNEEEEVLVIKKVTVIDTIYED